jgi:N-hydroxyarylamine O-acetyltransferase
MNGDTRADVDAYLRRIRFAGDVAPSLSTLAALLRAHARWIPFENLDVLLRRPIRLDVPSVAQKLVHSRPRRLLLRACDARRGDTRGDRICASAAHGSRRVVHTAPLAPRTHMFLTVDVDGRSFVVDPGFGGLAPTGPVPLTAPDDAADRASHWMARDDGYWVLRARAGGNVVDCWVSTLDADNRVDFDVGNHYTATHPASPFVNRLMLRAETDGGSILVMNRNVKTVRADAVVETTLADRAALRAMLDAHFGFDLPEVLSLRVPTIEEWQ